MASVEKQLLGTETVHALRAAGVQSCICGLSANDSEDQFLKNGANAFMRKPFPCEKNALTTEIIRVLRTRPDLFSMAIQDDSQDLADQERIVI